MPTSLARFLAVVGSLAILGGVWLSWIDDVDGAHLPLRRLYGRQMDHQADAFVASIGVVLLACAILGLIGALLPARFPAFLGALIAGALTALLLIQEYRFVPTHLQGSLVGIGVWCTGAGAVALFVGSFGLHVDVQRSVLQS